MTRVKRQGVRLEALVDWLLALSGGASLLIALFMPDFDRGSRLLSELNDDDEKSLMPHSIVANYARMLCDNRSMFVETLFRAVKLNKLDVTKVLCKIVQVLSIPSPSFQIGLETVLCNHSWYTKHNSPRCKYNRKAEFELELKV